MKGSLWASTGSPAWVAATLTWHCLRSTHIQRTLLIMVVYCMPHLPEGYAIGYCYCSAPTAAPLVPVPVSPPPISLRTLYHLMSPHVVLCHLNSCVTLCCFVPPKLSCHLIPCGPLSHCTVSSQTCYICVIHHLIPIAIHTHRKF